MGQTFSVCLHQQKRDFLCPTLRHVCAFRIIYKIVAGVQTIKLRRFPHCQDTSHVFVRFFFPYFTSPQHLLILFFSSDIEPRREKHCSRWQRGGLELRGGQLLCPSARRVSRAAADGHQSAPRQHRAGRHSAGEGPPSLTSVLCVLTGTNQRSARSSNEAPRSVGTCKGSGSHSSSLQQILTCYLLLS